MPHQRNLKRDWLARKLESLDLSTRKEMVDNNEGVQAKTKNPSLNRRLELLHISKTAHYYETVSYTHLTLPTIYSV